MKNPFSARSITIIIAGSLFAIASLRAQNPGTDSLGIIPKPVSMERKQGAFSLNPDTRIVASPGSEAEAKSLSERLGWFARISPATQRPAAGLASPVIVLKLQPSLAPQLGAEGYQLSVQQGRVVIKAPATAGLFYGGITLVQLAFPNAQPSAQGSQRGGAIAIPCVEVTDYPRFEWRGMMLDSSRHFKPKEFIERFLDLMALQKMNRLHWHLVDSEGWRLEIKKYPKLTQISESEPASFPSEDPHLPGRKAGYKYGWLHGGGYYSQEDVKEIVAYAAARHITIMPEIEFPGHSMAALSAYPEFSTTGKVPETRSNISPDLYNVDDKTLQFFKDVLTEVMALFPGEYIHLGGDEAPKGEWKNSAFIQQKIKSLGLKNEDALQSWLFDQLAGFVAKKGRRAVGWEEIAKGGIPKSAVVMPWGGMGDGIAAANGGNDIIIATTYPNYFDSYQTDSPLEPKAYYGGITLASVYNQSFQYPEIKQDMAKHVLGAQAQLWAELMPKTSDVEYQAFPRSAALAEALWTPLEEKDFADFSKRLAAMTKLWDRYSPPVNYHYLVPAPFAHWTPQELQSHGAMDFVISDPDELHALSSGSCGVIFDYTKGGQGLNIHKVELVAGGQVVATDEHEGFSGAQKRRNFYNLHFQPLADVAGGVTLRVTADSGGGTDSYGDITIVTGQVLAQYDPRNYPLGTVPLGYWQPADLAAPSKPVTIDLGGVIDKAGTYQVEFRHSGGKDAAIVRNVILSENGKDMATLAPNARCGPDNKSVYVSLPVEKVDPSTKFELRVLLEPGGGRDSSGEVWINKIVKLDVAPSYKSGSVLAQWSPDKLEGNSYVIAQIDLPDGVISKSGPDHLTFQYTGGGCAADFKNVELLAGSTVVATDAHAGHSGNVTHDNQYTLTCASVPPAAKFSIQFQIQGSGGADSHGEIRLAQPQ